MGLIGSLYNCEIEIIDNYESFIRNVLSLDSDADTLSAIGGCVAENFYKKTGFDDKFLLKKFLPKELYDMVFTT